MTDRRNSDGTFAKGNPGGPGRPSRATESAYMRVVMDICTLDDWAEIVKRTLADAKAGDAQARAWLTAYLVGRPSTTAGAPTPTRVLAEEAAGVDPVEQAADALTLDRQSQMLRGALLAQREDEDR